MIESLDDARISDVVALHQQVLGHTLNSRLGRWFLLKLYRQTVLSRQNGFCYIYTNESEIVGFISFCRDHHRLESEIRRSLSFRDWMRVVVTLLAHPSWWPSFIRQLLFSRFLVSRYPAQYSMILTLGVAPDQQGKGVGSQLIQKAIKVIAALGVQDFFVDTEVTNTAAIETYKKNLFSMVGIKYGNVILHYGASRNKR